MNAPAELATLAPPFEPGIFYGMPGATYHGIEAMSASGAKKILRSPLHYKLMRDQPNEPTEAMQFGTVVHAGVLEPDTLDRVVCCAPINAPRRPTAAQINAKKPSPETLDAIAFWQEFNRASIGKVVLSADDHRRALACITAVRAHPGAAKLLDSGERELSLFWTDARYGVPCKCRDDIFSHGGVTDLKTCQDASPEGFGRQIANMLYHVAAAHYIHGHEHAMGESPRFYAFIAVESEPPHAVAAYALPSNAILAGAHLMATALERYAQALADGAWCGYPDTIDTIQIPAYALKFHE